MQFYNLDFSIFGLLQDIANQHTHDLDSIDSDQIEDALNYLEDNSTKDEFTLEFDGNEYRIISDSEIWGIYVDSIRQITEDCYDLKLDKLPAFLAFEIDWVRTAENCYADGYGHIFATYDGEELESGDWWVFRVN